MNVKFILCFTYNFIIYGQFVLIRFKFNGSSIVMTALVGDIFIFTGCPFDSLQLLLWLCIRVSLTVLSVVACAALGAI